MINKDAMDELKHSIRMHMLIMQGPTNQLAVFLVKLIDFMEDDDQDRCLKEILLLSFAITESIAIHVQQSIDMRSAKDQKFPEHIKHKSNNLLVMLGKCKSLPDKKIARITLLREISDCIKALGSYTNSKYPTLTDLQGNAL